MLNQLDVVESSMHNLGLGDMGYQADITATGEPRHQPLPVRVF
jgi:hypothetical protein